MAPGFWLLATGKTDSRDLQKKREASNQQPVAKEFSIIDPVACMNCAVSL
jgi:hypothetical protein